MTEKLYERYPDMTSCEALVTDCREENGMYAAALDKTVLFPTGGGQLCDKGTTNGEEVMDVSETDGTVWHRLKKPLEPGSLVQVELDALYRMDNSQQHTGEHIMSFSFWKLFGAKNVGFHMNEEVITIDLDKELTHEQLMEAEDYANAEIWKDKPVDIIYRMENDLGDIPMRKVTEKAHGMLRVVVIPDGDACTCCGTHVKSTGAVGLIKIFKAERHRGGMRIECACGRRALLRLRRCHDTVAGLMTVLSTGEDELINSVKNLKSELKSAGMRLSSVSGRLMDYTAAEALADGAEKEGVKVVCVGGDFTPGEAKQLLTRLLGGENTLAFVCYPQGERLGYIAGRGKKVKFSCRQVSDLANALFNGKGGGRDELVQGAGKYTKDYKELVTVLRDSILRMI